MLDIKFIRENVELVKQVIHGKRVEVDIDKLLQEDEKRRKDLHQLETLRAKHRQLSGGYPGKPPQEILAQLKTLSKAIKDREEDQRTLQEAYETLLWRVPNIVHATVPPGKDETENKVVRQVGTPPKFDFKALEHWELGAALGVLDSARTAEVSGARFVYLKGKLVLLQFALINFALAILTNAKTLTGIAKKAKLKISTKPFIPVLTPVLMRSEIMHKMARLEPREERYAIQSDDLYLVGSAEHTLGPLHMNETLKEEDLPLRYVGYSTCFRREAGTYGKDTKGLMRLHQFDKVEMESFTTPEQGLAEQDFLIAIQEYFMQELGLPYQVVFKCLGDMGAPDFREFDIEAWLPGQGKYRETHTADYMTDYQARRLNIKVKSANEEMRFVHMNDATALAMSRTPVAILENYQQKDGSIRVPKALVPYCGFEVIK